MLPLADRITQANALLSPLAVPHEGRLGRNISEPEDAIRFPFQRDRDRILHAAAFRRLQGKTQVFVDAEDDYVRTRLTHTMEVAQIGRDLARALRLNEDLTECIALAHDLGHPPFGHSGEEALDAWMRTQGAHFEHNEQSLRIVTLLEKHRSGVAGLNLNREVEEGLRKHAAEGHRTAESALADLSDEIAYLSHDCDDGLRAGFFSLDDLRTTCLGRAALERTEQRGSYVRGALTHLMVIDLIAHSAMNISFSSTMHRHMTELRTFLTNALYLHPAVRSRAEAGKRIITALCTHYQHHETEKILSLRQRTHGTPAEAIKDYVAGMTDVFARAQALRLGWTDDNAMAPVIR